MKTFLEFMREDFSPDMQNFLKNNEMNRKMKSKEPAEPSKFAPLDPNWQEKMNNKFNAIANSKPVDFSGSRYGDEGIVSDQDKITRQNQNRLRRDYQQPPGYDTPAFDKAKERMAAADARDGEPPMPGAGPYKFKRADPLKTPQSVPIGPTSSTNIQKPKAKPAEIDQRVPRPKARPEVQGPNNQDRIPQEVKGLQPGNPDTSLDILKGFRYDPEKDPNPNTQVKGGKGVTAFIGGEYGKQAARSNQPVSKTSTGTNRLPQKSNVSTSGMGPFAISKGDPNSLRYQKASDVSKYIPRTRTKPEVVSTSKSVTIGSDKGTGTLWDIAKKRVGKGGDINKEIQRIRSLNNNIDPRKLKKGQKITVDEAASPQKFYDVPAGTFRPQYDLQKGDLGSTTIKRLSTEVPTGSSDAAYAAMIGSTINRLGDPNFASNKSLGQVFSDKSQFPKQPKTKITPEFQDRMRRIAADVAAGKFPAVERDADQWRSTSYLNTPRTKVWGKQGGKKVMGGQGKTSYKIATAQNAPDVGKQTFISTSPNKGTYEPYELPKMTKDSKTGVIRKAGADEPVLPVKGFASSRGMTKNIPSSVNTDDNKKTRPKSNQAPAVNAPKKQSFRQAFAAAKKAGLKKFSHNGEEYNTKVGK